MATRINSGWPCYIYQGQLKFGLADGLDTAEQFKKEDL
jgi:hypothetical protein